MGNKTTLIVAFSAILVLFFGMTLFDDAQAMKSKGNSLTEVSSKQVCGNFLCDEPMSIAEKIAIYLLTLVQQEETETEILQQSAEGIRNQQGIRMQIGEAQQRQTPKTDFSSVMKEGLSKSADVALQAGSIVAPFFPDRVPNPNVVFTPSQDTSPSKLVSKLINKYDLKQERLTVGVKKSIDVLRDENQELRNAMQDKKSQTPEQHESERDEAWVNVGVATSSGANDSDTRDDFSTSTTDLVTYQQLTLINNVDCCGEQSFLSLLYFWYSAEGKSLSEAQGLLQKSGIENIEIGSPDKSFVKIIDITELVPTEYRLPLLNAKSSDPMTEEFRFQTSDVSLQGLVLNIPTQGDLIRQRDFITSVQIDGIPEQLSIYAVSAGTIGFMVPPDSFTQSRSGEIREGDTMMLSYSPVTFSAQGNKDAINAVFETFKKVAEGDPLRGSITISIVNPADNYNVIHTFELQELTLLNYSPGISSDVNHPSTLSFEFTVLPNRIELK